MHGTDTPTDMVDLLYSSDKTPFVSVSLIAPCTPEKTKTFWDRKSGFVLSANHIDVANIAKEGEQLTKAIRTVTERYKRSLLKYNNFQNMEATDK